MFIEIMRIILSKRIVCSLALVLASNIPALASETSQQTPPKKSAIKKAFYSVGGLISMPAVIPLMMFGEWTAMLLNPPDENEKRQMKEDDATEKATIRSLKLAVKQDPTSQKYERLADYLNKRAHVYGCIRKYRTACRHAELEHSLPDAGTRTTLARINLKVGQLHFKYNEPKKAVAAFDKCLSYSPNDDVLEEIRKTIASARSCDHPEAYQPLLERINKAASH